MSNLPPPSHPLHVLILCFDSNIKYIIKTLIRCMQHSQEVSSKWNLWLTDSKKRNEILEPLWFLTKTHMNLFSTTASEFGKEKVAKKLGELKCNSNKQQACLLDIVVELATKSKEQTLSVKWALDLIYQYIDNKIPK